MSDAAFIGLDLETTGLDDHFDIILEVGIVIFDASLKPLAAWSSVVQPREDHIALRQMNDVVKQMHIDSGLCADLKDGMGRSSSTVSLEARRFIQKWTDKKLPMLGSSVTFDRTFLNRYMPELLELFSYRSLDATSVKLATLTQYPGDGDAEFALNHAAGLWADDILDDLDLDPRYCKPHRPIYDICTSAGLTIAATSFTRWDT